MIRRALRRLGLPWRPLTCPGCGEPVDPVPARWCEEAFYCARCHRGRVLRAVVDNLQTARMDGGRVVVEVRR